MRGEVPTASYFNRTSMNLQLKPHNELPQFEVPRATRRKSHTPLIVVSLLVALIVAGVVWWSRQETARQPAGGGRNAAPMSIVPEIVAKISSSLE